MNSQESEIYAISPGCAVLMFNKSIGLLIGKYEANVPYHPGPPIRVIYYVMWHDSNGKLMSTETWKPEIWIKSVIK